MTTRSPLQASATASWRPTDRRRDLLAVSAALVAALWLAAFALGAAPAGAHSDEGEMEITRLDAASGDSIAVEVGIRYVNDGHLAEDATARATAIGPDGRRSGPVELTRVSADGSLYAAALNDVGPGEWIVQVDSTDPIADATGRVEVAEPAGGATADGDGAGTADGLPSADVEATTPDGTLDDQVILDADPMATGDDLEGGLPFVAFVGAVAAVAVTGGALTMVRRRENAARDAGTTPSD